VPDGGAATEIVLDGRCPRCLHPTASTHPLRAVVSADAAREQAARDEVVSPSGHAVFRVVAECGCAHEHTGTPGGRHGCGAPYAVWVSWPTADGPAGRARDVTVAPAAEPSALDVEEARVLRTAGATQLVDIRKAAESWRTGLAGFLAILVAVFFIKGKDSFDDIGGGGLKRALAVLLLVSAALALFGAYRALRAAYGTPRDEYLGEVSWPFRHLPATTPRNIYDYGTVSAWRHAAARTAVDDLRLAKVATVASLLSFAAAAAITWFAPGPSAPAYVRADDGRGTVCGRLLQSSGGMLTIEPRQGETRTLALARLVSLDVVPSCP
jgi:hypothetical protein